jgi:hypothetical protein
MGEGGARSLNQQVKYKYKSRKAASPFGFIVSSDFYLALDEPFFQHLLVAQPQIRNIR